jgi:hypothetical protein
VDSQRAQRDKGSSANIVQSLYVIPNPISVDDVSGTDIWSRFRLAAAVEQPNLSYLSQFFLTTRRRVHEVERSIVR